jgi:hypothetical protein
VVQSLIFTALFVLSLFSNALESIGTARLAIDNPIYFDSNDSHNGPHDVDHPLASNGALPAEANEEKDSEKEIDDDDGKEYWHRFINKTLVITSTESSWRCCTLLSQSRPSVSFFILYHSWKSHLS